MCNMFVDVTWYSNVMHLTVTVIILSDIWLANVSFCLLLEYKNCQVIQDVWEQGTDGTTRGELVGEWRKLRNEEEFL